MDTSTYLIPRASISIGVFWWAWHATPTWTQAGFWHSLLYGLFWEVWVGYRFAEWLWR